MIFIKNRVSALSRPSTNETETFWASYSDLMAGLLMIFALTTIITLLYIGQSLIKPTKAVREWKEVIDAIRNDKELSQIHNYKREQIPSSNLPLLVTIYHLSALKFLKHPSDF